MKSRFTALQIIEAYKATGSVWRAGKSLGLAGQTVHERLRALGYPMPTRKWDKSEDDELCTLVDNGLAVGEIARRLGRSFAGVACRMNELGIRKKKAQRAAPPRGAGYDKESTLRHMRALESGNVRVTPYARSVGLNVDTLVGCFERYCADRWAAFVAKSSTIPEKQCPNCSRSFIPMTAKQQFCSRKCNGDHNRNLSYFGGQRNNTIGLLEGVCQLCSRTGVKGLSSHHIIGKENDPENQSLIALCPGCHKIVTILSTRKGVNDEAFWESLISLCWLRHNGDHLEDVLKVGHALFVSVEVETGEDDEAAA